MNKKVFALILIDFSLFIALIAAAAGRNSEYIKAEETSSCTVRNNNEEVKKVALTFDDGPHVVYTKELLDGLKEREVKATFFVLGQNAEANPDIIKKMHEEGHLIGNHTYSHVQLTRLTSAEQCDEISRTNDLIYDITGEYPQYIRPPFGEWDDKAECKIVMIPVLWSVDTLDWTTENSSSVVKKGTKNIKDGDIILMHDFYKSSVKAALSIVDILKAEGFEFVTVDELITD